MRSHVAAASSALAMDVRNRIARRASARAMLTSFQRADATPKLARRRRARLHARARDAAHEPTRVVVVDDDAAAPCVGT